MWLAAGAGTAGAAQLCLGVGLPLRGQSAAMAGPDGIPQSVLVRVTGGGREGIPFYVPASGGRMHTSASGALLPNDDGGAALVLTSGALLQPWLKRTLSSAASESLEEGAELAVSMIGGVGGGVYYGAELLAIVPGPKEVNSLLRAGFALGGGEADSLSIAVLTLNTRPSLQDAGCGLSRAGLGLGADPAALVRAPCVYVVGAPFGVLCPRVFGVHVCAGMVAATLGAGLCLLDVRWLPGLDGAVVYDQCGTWRGLLLSPLVHARTRAVVRFHGGACDQN